MRWLCLLLICSAALPAQSADRFSREKEAALGASLAADIRKLTVPLEDDAVIEYVQTAGCAADVRVAAGPCRAIQLRGRQGS